MKFWRLFLRDLKETLRNPRVPLSLLAFPLLFMAVFGLALAAGNVQTYNAQVDFLAPGLVVTGLFAMIPVAAGLLLRDREQGYLARLLATSARPLAFITGYGLCMLLVAVVQIILLTGVAAIFGMSIGGNIFLAFVVFLLAAVASIGVGMVVGSLFRRARLVEPLIWLLTVPLAVFSGVLSTMPGSVRTFADIFPYAHADSAAREILVHGASMSAVQGDVLFLAGWAIGAALLGIVFFTRAMRR